MADICLYIKGYNQRLWYSHLACPFWNGGWEQRSAWTTLYINIHSAAFPLFWEWPVQLNVDDFYRLRTHRHRAYVCIIDYDFDMHDR